MSITMLENNQDNDCVIYNSISPLLKIKLHIAGPVVLHAIAHTKLQTPFEKISGGKSLELSDNDNDEEDEESNLIEDDLEYLRSLDPKDWKNQDHYAVLGLKRFRFEASEDLIKQAYKQKILKHHPDKRKAMGEEIRPDDDYFTCITRAWEMLGNPTKRRSYDSVDPFFDDTVPDEKDAKIEFYDTMGRAFEDNARWSVKQPVPLLGDQDTSREDVEKFYSFWYDFESWREYSYLDEEDKESGQDRDMRKWIEKKNKATRSKRKKEEMARIRSLVDTAYAVDPRIKKFQQEDKDKKLAAKRAKQEAAKARQMEEERLAKEAARKEREEKEKRELEEKARQDLLKQEREAMKKALKKERKALRDVCKTGNYFADNPQESIKHMESVEKMCELFKLNQLEEAIKEIQSQGRDGFLRIINETESKIEAERRAASAEGNPSDSRNPLEKQVKAHLVPWSEHDLQLLIKAVNLFPAGSNQRWEVVANFINQHSNNGTIRDAKEVLAKAKDLQSTDFSKSSLKQQANTKAFQNFITEKKNKEPINERMPAVVTERLDSPIKNSESNQPKTNENKSSPPWTPSEQKLLEQALKTYSNITEAHERWDLISNCIPTRTKKECMRRYKELVELIKAKKAAQTT
ncbi:dnaJ homolog subfamily C member 2 [Chelonus insularis]|uniref:dnaJ homolog subfamily C member 2 n=1 Tax=Chelonus insularis TaxID=460826 RepID=UPI00158D7DC7|nr:dnaJ homolog subfamily C member 2 [Chelonus insularis]